MAKGQKIHYSAQELAWIKAHKKQPRQKAHALFVAKFGRDDVSAQNYNALCKRMGWLTGRTGQFDKNHKSWNKGKKITPHPNSAKTQFKKGQTPHNTNYLGHERMTDEGYIMISVDQPNAHTGFERSYVLKHRYLWEQANSAVPADMALKCLDGNRSNCDPSNWALVKRSVLARLCARYGRDFDNAPQDLKPLILQTAKLAQAVADRRKREAENYEQ